MTHYRKCQEIGVLDNCAQEQIIVHGGPANFIKIVFVQYQYMPGNILAYVGYIGKQKFLLSVDFTF